MTDDYPHVSRAKGRSASICAATSTSAEVLPPNGSTPEAGTPAARRRRPATRSQSARIANGRSIRRRATHATSNNAEVKSHCNSEPKLDQPEVTPDVSPNIRRKSSQRRGTSVYHRKSTAFLDVPDPRSTFVPSNEEDEDSYRLRSFSFTSKGNFTKHYFFHTWAPILLTCYHEQNKFFFFLLNLWFVFVFYVSSHVAIADLDYLQVHKFYF